MQTIEVLFRIFYDTETKIISAVPKVMSHIILFCAMTSDADLGVTAVELKPFHQFSITFFCHMADSSREAI